MSDAKGRHHHNYNPPHHNNRDARIPDFLVNELAVGEWVQTGFRLDFPAMYHDPIVTKAMGCCGRNFVKDSIDIAQWFNRETRAITGSVFFSEDCEGPPGHVHGGAVASALDDILANIVSRNFGFSRAGILTMELKVKYRGPIPLRKQLHLNTKVVNWEGRKVLATASLRDPCSGKLLAEGDGLFYLKKLAPPLQDTSTSRTATRYASTSEADGRSSPKRPRSTADATVTRPRSTADATVTTASPLETFPEMIPYDEAIQYFGPINPNATQNLVTFFKGGVTALHRAKL